MSGICGIVSRDKDLPLSQEHLVPMVHALDVARQGPGVILTSGPVGMAAQRFPGRLAGLAEAICHGHRFILAFHGSLYNLKHLISLTEQEPDPITALLGLYLREAMTFINRLRGEFALAIWDGLEESLHLATDRFRVHPLFYYQDQNKFVFGSSMKGILTCPLPITRTINPEAIVDVIASSMIPTPKTIFREVNKLPPGHHLTYREGEVTLSPYWIVTFNHPDPASKKELARKLRSHMTEAVSTRLESDRASDRIGTFLSGGIDSSTLTGTLTRLVGRPIKSFSIGFDVSRFNEISYARIAARAFAAEHYEYSVTPKDVFDAIPILLHAFDEPFANASAVPVYFCAKLARDHGVDFLYAGDGGDELFAGNERYATQRLFDYYSHIPAPLRTHLINPVIFTLADKLPLPLFSKGKKYIQRASLPYHERISSYNFFRVLHMTDFFEPAFLETLPQDYDPYAITSQYYFQVSAKHDLDRHLYIDWKLTLADNDLIKVTRMTEALAIAVRYPFLDNRLVDFSVTIPANIKMKGTRLRSFFKTASADLLPPEIRRKQKHGFALPIPVWLRSDTSLSELMHDLALGARICQRGYFRKKTVQDLIAAHKTDETSFYGTALWNLMMLELWLRNYDTA